MKFHRRSRKGSSTVLVILIMLALIVFGLITMMNSSANYKISKRLAEWTKDYYVLESMALESYKNNEGVYDEEKGLYILTVEKDNRIFEVAYTETGEIVVWREQPQEFEIVEIQFGTRRSK